MAKARREGYHIQANSGISQCHLEEMQKMVIIGTPVVLRGINLGPLGFV